MDVRLKKVIHKYYEYGITKIVLLYKQRKYRNNSVSLKYIFERDRRSKDLVIVFSSCTRRGIKARYNYMRTLSGICTNKLFILDDFAKDKRGSYYLGENWNFTEEKATVSLIKWIIEKYTLVGKTIFCGSSKGGYSALNFGLQFDPSYIVAGAPQYYLAQYLAGSRNIECLEHIMGEETQERLNELDNRLKKRILDCENPHKHEVYLNYSNREHTYAEHIEDIIRDLNKRGFFVKEKIEDYENHSDISLFFPDFLRQSITFILGK